MTQAFKTADELRMAAEFAAGWCERADERIQRVPWATAHPDGCECFGSDEFHDGYRWALISERPEAMNPVTQAKKYVAARRVQGGAR